MHIIHMFIHTSDALRGATGSAHGTLWKTQTGMLRVRVSGLPETAHEEPDDTPENPYDIFMLCIRFASHKHTDAKQHANPCNKHHRVTARNRLRNLQ